MASDKMLGSFDQKTTPEDNDLLVEYDASASKVKNVKFGGVWNWIVKKLTSAVISELQTSNQSVVGAINELNSKKVIINSGQYTISNIKSEEYNITNIRFEFPYTSTDYIVVATCADGGYVGFSQTTNKTQNECTLSFRNTTNSTLSARLIIWQTIGY